MERRTWLESTSCSQRTPGICFCCNIQAIHSGRKQNHIPRCAAKHFSFLISTSYFAGTGGRLSWIQVTLQTMICRWRNKELKMVYSTTHFLQPPNLNHFASSHWFPRDTKPNNRGDVKKRFLLISVKRGQGLGKSKKSLSENIQIFWTIFDQKLSFFYHFWPKLNFFYRFFIKGGGILPNPKNCGGQKGRGGSLY